MGKMMEPVSLARTETLRANLMHVKFLSGLDDEEMQRLVDVMGVYFFKKGDLVCQTGEVRSTMFIIERGSCASYSKGKLLHKHEPGDCLYEMALLEDSMRSADTVVESPMATMLGLERNDFQRLIGHLRISVIPNPYLEAPTEVELREEAAYHARRVERGEEEAPKKNTAGL